MLHIRILMQLLPVISLLPRHRFMPRILRLRVSLPRRFCPISHRFMERLRYRELRIHFGFLRRRKVCNGTGLPRLPRFRRHRARTGSRLTGDGLCRRTIGGGGRGAHGSVYGIQRLVGFRRLR